MYSGFGTVLPEGQQLPAGPIPNCAVSGGSLFCCTVLEDNLVRTETRARALFRDQKHPAYISLHTFYVASLSALLSDQSLLRISVRCISSLQGE